jgi:quercetin 2,3-dioxygenase
MQRLTSRNVSRVMESDRVMEGAGMPVRRAFPTNALEDIDPFLLLDHLGPKQFGPGEATGFPDHPHRGFETVTYVLEGAMEHRDSHGNHGILGPGDVQWMTAGSGLVHSEMPGTTLRERGGRLHGFQLWVNLP